MNERCESSDPKGEAHGSCELRKGHDGLCRAVGQTWSNSSPVPAQAEQALNLDAARMARGAKEYGWSPERAQDIVANEPCIDYYTLELMPHLESQAQAFAAKEVGETVEMLASRLEDEEMDDAADYVRSVMEEEHATLLALRNLYGAVEFARGVEEGKRQERERIVKAIRKEAERYPQCAHSVLEVAFFIERMDP